MVIGPIKVIVLTDLKPMRDNCVTYLGASRSKPSPYRLQGELSRVLQRARFSRQVLTSSFRRKLCLSSRAHFANVRSSFFCWHPVSGPPIRSRLPLCAQP